MLRKYLREGSTDYPTVLILSAKYGLIGPERKIPSYDQRLANGAADKLRPKGLRTARRILRSGAWRSVGVCAGKEYQSALDGLAELLPAGVRFDLLGGGWQAPPSWPAIPGGGVFRRLAVDPRTLRHVHLPTNEQAMTEPFEEQERTADGQSNP